MEKEDSKLPFVVIHCTAESKEEQPKEKEVEVKPYYFDCMLIPDEFRSNELCDVKKDGTCIGSKFCWACENCTTFGRDFIKCKLKPEDKIKKQTERFKRDEYGVISKTTDPLNRCKICAYKKEDGSLHPCKSCLENIATNEYYSSK